MERWLFHHISHLEYHWLADASSHAGKQEPMFDSQNSADIQVNRDELVRLRPVTRPKYLDVASKKLDVEMLLNY